MPKVGLIVYQSYKEVSVYK